VALANFSRVPSPELTPELPCCCLRADCEHTKAWSSFKSKLESRLILSAEVGQALLQRHEAYVRRHESRRRLRSSPSTSDRETQVEASDVETQVAELQKEKASLEKLLNQSLVNNEVAEVSNQTVLHELQEARAAITRLTSQNVRLMSSENRLNLLNQEKQDLQQERDIEAQKARSLENKTTVLQDRLAKLQAEVRRLHNESDQQRSHRMETSESLLQDAKERIEDLRRSLGSSAAIENDELTNMLRSLIQDNEKLKQDNAELQALLSSTREDVNSLQQELEEHRAIIPSRPTSRLHHRQHFYSGSVPSIREVAGSRRPPSLERKFRYPTVSPSRNNIQRNIFIRF
jgi:chromosome segregation ATPase